jgi:hypothetical protein
VHAVRKGGFKECIQQVGIKNFGENQSKNHRNYGSLTGARRWMELNENYVQ